MFSRRSFLQYLGLAAAGLAATSCERFASPTQADLATMTTSVTPTPVAPTTITLLERLQRAGVAAASVTSPKYNGKAIAINGSIAHNFLVDKQYVGVGADGSPTLDVGAIMIPITADVSYT